MSETMTVEELIAKLRGWRRYGDDAALARDLLAAADALEAGLRVAKPFVELGPGWENPMRYNGDLRALRDWTKGIYT